MRNEDGHSTTGRAAASGRTGGWFLWRDSGDLLRPFSNRGPAVRFMAPGDDVPDPFAPERSRHAESSGATAFVAGVCLLVLGRAPELTVAELHGVLVLAAARPDPALDAVAAVADARELAPAHRDVDGHNAKHGYGRLSASLACLAATESLVLAALSSGLAVRRATIPLWPTGTPSAESERFICRWLLRDRDALHHLAVIVRHLRLAARDAASPTGTGALARQVALFFQRAAAQFDAPSDLVGVSENATDTTADDGQTMRTEFAMLAAARRKFCL